MSALLINGEIVDMTLKSLFDEVFFIFSSDVVENGLNRMGTLLVAADLDKVIPDQVQNLQSLRDRAVRKQLLKEVVAILIAHDRRKLLANFF